MAAEQCDSAFQTIVFEIQNKGVRPGNYIALLCDRQFELVISLLAVVKAGCAFLPIDLNYPKQRILFTLEDSKAEAVITTSKELDVDGYQGKVIYADVSSLNRKNLENPNVGTKPEDTAYVIYTSGTTGKPKGVLLSHAGVANMAAYIGDLYQVTEKDVVLQFANNVFDASIWEFTLALLTKSGASLCLVEKEIINNTKQSLREIF